VCPAFFLQSHIFLCRAHRYWVILDVNRDKYLCVDRPQFESLGPWIDGWEEKEPRLPDPGSEPSLAAIALANNLLTLQILSERPVGAKIARATAYDPPTSAVDLDAAANARLSQCAHSVSFFLSCARASRQLRKLRFETIIACVQARKGANRSAVRGFDLERARSLISVFDNLRLFYSRSYVCLFDSLALIHFLARFEVYPDWVFGVRADPFEAHCWVQAGSVVLNDTVERVSALTPIMSV
jgi:hypothetical protein